ncbi:hypothetical protein ACEN9X_20365 [Mucilaginibacter sp. Mucisp86]|uniref:hypothetical protein n=1 Tax=Mucilaginibacter sp. Mucisp86 TaxID=3243060 RepID=UPI0039B5C669
MAFHKLQVTGNAGKQLFFCKTTPSPPWPATPNIFEGQKGNGDDLKWIELLKNNLNSRLGLRYEQILAITSAFSLLKAQSKRLR